MFLSFQWLLLNYNKINQNLLWRLVWNGKGILFLIFWLAQFLTSKQRILSWLCMPLAPAHGRSRRTVSLSQRGLHNLYLKSNFIFSTIFDGQIKCYTDEDIVHARVCFWVSILGIDSRLFISFSIKSQPYQQTVASCYETRSPLWRGNWIQWLKKQHLRVGAWTRLQSSALIILFPLRSGGLTNAHNSDWACTRKAKSYSAY